MILAIFREEFVLIEKYRFPLDLGKTTLHVIAEGTFQGDLQSGTWVSGL